MQKQLLNISLLLLCVLTACTSAPEGAEEILTETSRLIAQDRNYNEATEMLLASLAQQDEKVPTIPLIRTYEYLSRCYWEQEYDKEATDYARKGYAAAMQLDNDSLQYQLANRLASCHYTSGQHDSARYYYEQVRAIGLLRNDSVLLLNATNNIGAVLLSKLAFHEALEQFEESKRYSKNRRIDNFKYHYNRSRCFFHMNQWEDCAREVELCRQYTPINDFEGWQKLYQRLYTCQMNMGDFEAACHSADSVFMYTDSIYKVRHREEMKGITSKFQQEQHEAEIRLMQSHWILAVVNGVFIAIILVVVIMYRNKRRILQLQDEMHSLSMKIALEEGRHKSSTEEEDDEEDTEAPVRAETQPISENLANLYFQQLNVARELFRSRPAYDRLQQLKFHTDKNYLSDEQRLPLIDSVTEVFLDPIQRLRSTFPELTADECLYAILTFIGCNNATISMVTKTTEATLRKRRSRIKQKTTERVFSVLIGG